MQTLQLVIGVIVLIAAVFIRTNSIWWDRTFPFLVLSSFVEAIAARLDHDRFSQGFWTAIAVIGLSFVLRDRKDLIRSWRRHD